MDDAQFLEELKKDFFDEAKTLIDILESNILILEKDFDNQEAINEIFRSAHTLKGGSATLDLDRIANFTHEMESLLDEIRSGNIRLNSDIVDTLLKSIDIVKNLIDASLNDREPPSNLESEAIKEMKSIYQPELNEETKKEAIKIAKEIVESRPKVDYNLNEYDRYLLRTAPEEGYEIYDVYVLLNKNNPMKTVSGIQIHSILKEFSQIVKSIPDLDDLFQDKFYKEVNFLILSKKSKSYIKDKITISDVTELVQIREFEDTESLISELTSQDRIKSEEVKLEFSESEIDEIKRAKKDEKNIIQIVVDFDETNPMRSVSGLLIYTMLSSYGDIITSTPQFEDLKEDKFYETAIFILATYKDETFIKNHIYISDITKSLEFKKITFDEESEEIQGTEEKSIKVFEPKEELEEADQEMFPDDMEETETEEEIDISSTKKQQTSQSTKKQAESSSSKPIKKDQQSQILRVHSKRIDQLVNLVSQLVIEKGSFTKISDISTEIYEFFNSNYSNFKKDLYALFDEITSTAKIGNPEKEDVHQDISYQETTEITEENEDIENNKLKALYKEHIDKLAKTFDNVFPKIKDIQDKIKDVNSKFNMITNDIHESVMKVRMVPISQLFQRFPRVVRDLSKSLKKEVDLITEGEDTELDKNTIENLVHPLIHIIRNAMDHGIENSEKRKKLGKPEKGIIHLKAKQEGNLVVITVSDDGQGLDLNRIKQKAVNNGLIEPNADLTENEIINLIFLPGFSTKENATDLSGRGVGMDVVKKAIESERGHVYISSKKGEGTTFTLKLPLTMAIIQALEVRVGSNIYCIPINSIIETSRLKDDMIERLEGNEIVRLRDEIISVVRLEEIFNIKEKSKTKNKYIIYVGTENKKIGLVVDQLITEESIVIKPLNNKYVESLGITGASILGDGSVALILEIPGIMELMLKERKKKYAGIKL